MRLIAIASLLTLCQAIPAGLVHHIVHERRAVDPLEWVQDRRLEADKVIPLRIGLSQSNLHRIEELLAAVAHPESEQYGQHMTPDEVVQMFAPSDETVDAVKNWLAGAGFGGDRLKVSANKAWLQLDATVEEAEALLKTEYHVFTHSESGVQRFGCHSYSVPAYVQSHVDLIKPTVHFNHRPNPHRVTKRTGGLGAPHLKNGPKKSSAQFPSVTPGLTNCDEAITLDCIRALYAFEYTPQETNKNSFGIVEFTPQAYIASDLDMFFTNFTPSLVGSRPTAVLIDGAVIQTTNQSFDYNGESDLDLEYAMSLTAPQKITLLQTGDLVEGAGFDNWLDAVDGSFCTFEGGDDPTQDGIYPDTLPGGYDGPESCGITALPNVVSISYGQPESSVTAKYGQRQCTEYAKLGLLGSTILYSSGDNGVAGGGDACLNSQLQPVDNGTVFNPGFPVTCPYVTAVGATQINPGNTVYDPEGACEQVIYSGGGFSNIFAMPSYQATAVNNYFAQHNPTYLPHGSFNNSRTVRGFPDLSANGANYVIAIDGQFGLVFGTSASAPVVASMITMINDARLAAGKGPVGFINPAIYSSSFASAFNDITSGTNQGCGTSGFTAVSGWDPVTGVGTPNFSKLLPLFLSLP